MVIDDFDSCRKALVNSLDHFLTSSFFFRPTHLLESHVSGQMVKREVTEEGEVKKCVNVAGKDMERICN